MEGNGMEGAHVIAGRDFADEVVTDDGDFLLKRIVVSDGSLSFLYFHQYLDFVRV